MYFHLYSSGPCCFCTLFPFAFKAVPQADVLRRSSRNPPTFLGEEDCVTNAFKGVKRFSHSPNNHHESWLPCNYFSQRFHWKPATGEFRRLFPRLLPPIISINYTDFHNFLRKHALQTLVGKRRLTAPFLPQPPTSQNQPHTINLIETPAQYNVYWSARILLLRTSVQKT